jgi:RNA-binding protein 39
MNGQQLNGRPIRVGLVTQKSSLPHISLDDTDNPGFALTSQSRTELMQKLARQEDESVYLNSKSRSPTKSSNAVLASSRSVILKNMFNPDE